MNRLVFFMCLCVWSCNSYNELFEGAACAVDGVVGTCVNIKNCLSALSGLKKGKMPQTCSFSGSDPIVCCLDAAEPATAGPAPQAASRMQWATSAAPNTEPPTTTVALPTTTPAALPTTTPATTLDTTVDAQRTETKFSGQEVGGMEGVSVESSNDCPPIPADQTAAKTGQKAWDKCIEYQERLLYPCDAGRGMRYNNCGHDLNTWILGGEDAFDGEFPHMALVGYGSDPEALVFLCGGSLISERFVLTAGHCTSSRDLGPISYVLLGVLKRSSYQQSQLQRVRAVIKHPQYRPPKKYNDIALLELENRMQLTEMTVPACLDVGGAPEMLATATGWGATQFRGMNADIMQKVELSKFADAECAALYEPSRLLQRGFDNSSQICYGDRSMSKDTCQGDSGGPLQVRHRSVHCMYSVIGVTSFGRVCGVAGQPALYTRIAHYVPWIESVVWPDN